MVIQSCDFTDTKSFFHSNFHHKSTTHKTIQNNKTILDMAECIESVQCAMRNPISICNARIQHIATPQNLVSLLVFFQEINSRNDLSECSWKIKKCFSRVSKLGTSLSSSFFFLSSTFTDSLFMLNPLSQKSSTSFQVRKTENLEGINYCNVSTARYGF